MVLRLVLDAVRRKWLIGAFAVFQLYILFKIPLQVWPASDGMAWTMAGAWFLTIGAGELFSTRELYQLPVSRRTWWLSRWWLSMTAPVAVAQLAAIFAYWSNRSEWPAVEYVVLSVAFVVLYCGCALAYHATTFGRSGDAPATFISAVTFMPIFIGFLAAPFLLAPYLPHSFAEMSATSAIVLVVMAAFTAYGYRHTPAIQARPDMRLARRVSSLNAPASVVDMKPAELAGRLTGLTLVLWEECRRQLIIFSSIIAIGVAYWAVATRFRPMPALGEFLRLASVLPFSTPKALITEPIVFGALLAVATIAEPGMLANIRSLRILPVSSARLSYLPLGLGLVSATMFWIVLLALHGLVLRTVPSSVRPDLFIAFAALAALAHTIRFVMPGQAPIKGMLSFVPVAITWLALGFFGDSWRADVVQPAMFIGGLLILVASWAVMRRSVMRSSSMYQQPRSVAI